MRRTAAALTALLLLAAAPTAAATEVGPSSAASPKVVIVVGATHDVTPRYRDYAIAAAAVAREYTSDVVEVYSPNATWSAVRTALQGASIVIYMGHGNGFPSPYRTTPWPYSQNGFGLNAAAGQGDHNNQYYGEQYIASEVQLAPNAVVLLHHLCYASGNSEPGRPEPTLEVARQRVDNYAAGFLRAGASVVIADGHRGPESYLRGLFGAPQALEDLWRSIPNYRGNELPFDSTRTPGTRLILDPNTPTSGFYRSIAGDLALRTSRVIGALDGIGTNPAPIVVIQVPRTRP